MRTFTIKGREFLGIMIFLLIVMFTEILFINEHCSYFTLSILSIIELVSGIIIINNFTQFKVISIPTFFVVFNWVFHCGQIILKGFNLSGSVPLDFTLYASFNNQIKAFNFYYLAQAIIVVAIVLVSGKNRHYESKYIQGIDGRISGLVFILIGIIPRLYVDGLKLAGGIASGYKGVYSLYIPQFVNTLAFFFDVGVVIQLLRIENTKVRRRLFWIILIYKAIAMMTGARQEKVAFLIIWLFIYYFYESLLIKSQVVNKENPGG